MILKNKFTFAGEKSLMPAHLCTALLGVEIACGVKERTLLQKQRAARATRRRWQQCAMPSELKSLHYQADSLTADSFALLTGKCPERRCER